MNRVGDVILAARQAASMTQEDLCLSLGITQAALSRYEHNLRVPDEVMCQRIADALGLTTAFLSHSFTLQGAIGADAHMRRQKTTKASDWKRAEARLNLLRMHSSFLLERIPMDASNHVPTFDPDDTSPEDAARMVRAQWKMPLGPVRNLIRWIESAGVVIVEEELGTRRMDGLSQWASNYPVILLNESLPVDRKRLTLAHELGHLVMHTNHVDVDMENQANAFAAEFLMPEHIIKPSLRSLSLSKLVDLKVEWGVSMQAIFERAYRLGKVDIAERQKFYRAMNARGWKVREPAADRLNVESPSLAKSIGERLRSNGLTSGDIAQIVGINQDSPDNWFMPNERALRSV